MTKSLKIAVYPGDGIGPEVIDEAMRVLARSAKLDRGVLAGNDAVALGRRALEAAREGRAG